MSNPRSRKTRAKSERSASSGKPPAPPAPYTPTRDELAAAKAKGFAWDEAAATEAVEFIETYCRHTKGEWAGRLLILDPWQRDITRKIFGWKRAKDGTRRYRHVYVEIPRKNGKSTWASALALKLLFADREPGAEIYSAAADRDQAAITFDDAKKMAEADEDLAARCSPFRRSIVVPSSGSSYVVLSADVETKHGKNAHGIVFDELHTQPNRDLFDVLNTSTGARRQPLMLMFTTAGYDRKSICYEWHAYAEKVLAGVVEADSFLPVIYAAAETDDWKDPATWAKANPNLGVSVKLDYLEAECKRAQELPAYENTFRRLHLNQWTEQDVRWMAMDAWDACAGHVDVEELAGRECYGGLDLASTNDIAALELVFPPQSGDEDYQVLSFFWVPKENAASRARKDRVPYDVWIREDLIRPTEGNVVDYDVIRRDVNELAERFKIVELGYDPWNATQITTQLIGDGFTMVPIRQGFATLSAPTKELSKLVLGRRIRHGGNKVLRWMASNVAVEQDAAGNLKPSKKKSTERIDGVAALVMAIARACVRPETGPSVYESEGLLVL